MKIKKTIYFVAVAFFGMLLSFIAHGLIEIWYLNRAIEKGSPVTWTSYFRLGSCALPVYLQYGLFLAGLIGGLLLGRYWWHKIYEKK